MKEEVILVDEQDSQIGVCEKIVAHQQGLLHRAFSVFVFRKNNSAIELLLQQRQKEKYHSGGLWTNSCCGHPRPGENTLDAASRRLFEEMGIRVGLHEECSFTYRAEFQNGLIEHEIDHVVIGEFDEQAINFNSAEVSDYCWMEINLVTKILQRHPEKYTAWFKGAWEKAKRYL